MSFASIFSEWAKVRLLLGAALMLEMGGCAGECRGGQTREPGPKTGDTVFRSPKNEGVWRTGSGCRHHGEPLRSNGSAVVA